MPWFPFSSSSRLFHSRFIFAQSTNAGLTGRVTDPSEALIADAEVAAIGAGTNVRYSTDTNAAGEYYLANLPPGSYRIEIEKPGFRKLIRPDVILHVQDALEIDLEMTLGAASETITVEAGLAIGVLLSIASRKLTNWNSGLPKTWLRNPAGGS